MGHQKTNPGLSSFTAKELGLLGIPSEQHKAILDGIHPGAYLSRDKFCLFLKPGTAYDVMSKSATGKSETRIGTRIVPALDLTLTSRQVYNMYRVIVEVNPELLKLAPVSCPSIMEPDIGENANATVWRSQELSELGTLKYLYRLYMFT